MLQRNRLISASNGSVILNMRIVMIGFACVALALCGCSSGTRSADGILVSVAGKYAPKGKTWMMDVAPDGNYVLTYANSRETIDWTPQQGWFLFIEDKDHFWTYDGGSDLFLYAWSGEGQRRSMGRHDPARYRRAVPGVVVQTLPLGMRDILLAKRKQNGLSI